MSVFGRRWLLISLALMLVACERRPAVDGRNILLISIDSLRADHLGCYGYAPPTSPRMDAFAREGVRFANGYAGSPWTLPSHATMFTGLYPESHGIYSARSKLKEDAFTVAGAFHKAGYATGAVVCAPLLDKRYGLDLGFDTYDDDLIAKSYIEARRVKVGPTVTEKGLAWMKKHGERPFFLFLHYWDVHYDYNPPPEYEKIFDPDYQGAIDGFNIHDRTDLVAGMNPRDLRHLVALYDGEIRYTDDAIGALLDGIAKLGLAENTAIWIVADHGEEFLEHGGTGHTTTCYEELIHIPMLARVPWLPGGKTIDYHASLIDLAPTLLDLAGLPTGKPQWQGISLAGLLRGEAAPSPRALIAVTRRGKLPGERHEFFWSSVLAPNRDKLHHLHRRDEPFDLRLFDLKTDPGEETNLADRQPDRAKNLRRELPREVQQMRRVRRALRADIETDLDPRLRDTLKGLGYVQ